MKNLILFALVVFAPSLFAKSYGEGAKGEASHQISELVNAKEDLKGKYVRVEGVIKEVCPMKGCWMQLEDTKTGQRIKVKVKDDVIVFPSDSVGKTAKVEGRLVARHLSQKQARRHFAHLAEELGRKFDPNSVKGPVTLYEIRGLGAEIN